ncbi:MAG TPA: ABC transporter permease subunit [Acidimicrobiia bacterium]|nr:ABC transporter permease subunit [Acidimicrobiia bacterium]
MSQAQAEADRTQSTTAVGGARRPPLARFGSWLGVLPFFLFSGMFLIAPAIVLAYRSLEGPDGTLTLDNYRALTDANVLAAYGMSIRLSLLTALVGGVFGFLLAWAVSMGGLGRSTRSGLSTFSGVASNFAGVPLAAAFVFTLGRVGVITSLFEWMGIELYDTGFSLYSFWGLALVYLYFQFPLMVLIILPAIDGLKQDWREAAENLGATPRQYWRRVAFPVLLPSILGTMILLFGNAFGAHATAYALTGGSLPLATLLIGQQISGDVLNNPGLGYAVAMGMVFIMALCIVIYSVLQRRSERWLG